MHDHAVVLRPGDLLLIGNVGPAMAEALAQAKVAAALGTVKETLGLAGVCVFIREIDVHATTPHVEHPAAVAPTHPDVVTAGPRNASVIRADNAHPTIDEAVCNAARLLRNAETDTNLAMMERLDEMASTWLDLAHLLMERQRDLT